MRVSDFLAELRDQGALMSAAACAAALTDPVPTCPGWTVRELLLHTGGVHRWATTIVGERRQEPVPLRPPETVPDPATWFATGHAALLRTLEAAGPLVCWTFQPAADPLLFWARRQAHETTIHRVDAELAAGLARTTRPSTVSRTGSEDSRDSASKSVLRPSAIAPAMTATGRCVASGLGATSAGEAPAWAGRNWVMGNAMA